MGMSYCRSLQLASIVLNTAINSKKEKDTEEREPVALMVTLCGSSGSPFFLQVNSYYITLRI